MVQNMIYVNRVCPDAPAKRRNIDPWPDTKPRPALRDFQAAGWPREGSCRF